MHIYICIYIDIHIDICIYIYQGKPECAYAGKY